MQIVNFTCPLPPSVNSYLGKRVAYNPINKKPFVQVYETSEAKAFKKLMKKTIKREVINNGWIKTGMYDYVVCEVEVYIPQKKRDSDNIFKCLLDGIIESDIIYDDSMIEPRVKNIYIDAENPRVEVTIYKDEKIGVFKNSEHLEEFKTKNCYKCKRLKRNCSLLKKSMENRIIPEIDFRNLKCQACNE